MCRRPRFLDLGGFTDVNVGMAGYGERVKIAATVLGLLLSVVGFSAPAAAAPESRVIVVGDSIAWAYADHVTTDERVINRSIPGSCLFVRKCSNPDAPRYMQRLRDAGIRAGDIVVISIGHNDLEPGRARDYAAAYRKAVRYVEKQDARPLVATITPFGGELLWGRDEMNDRRIKVNQWILNHTPSVDLTGAIGGEHMPSRFNSGDGLHPNAAGSQRLGEALTAALRD